MTAIVRERHGQFRVRFSELERGVRGVFRPSDRPVDPFAICQAVVEIMRQASMRAASGRRLLWNGYRVVLAAADYEPLRALDSRLRGDIEQALTGEAARLDAELVGTIHVDVVADESGELAAGEAVIRADFVEPPARASASPDITIRAHASMWAGEIDSGDPDSTVRDGGLVQVAQCVLSWPGHQMVLPAGVRTVLGRPHAGAPAGFLALTGASTRINKQQLWVMPGLGQVVLGRMQGGNPVEVGGTLVSSGEEISVGNLPVDVSLSRGDLIVRLSWS